MVAKYSSYFFSNMDESRKKEKRLRFKFADGFTSIAVEDFKTLEVGEIGPLLHDMLTLFSDPEVTIHIPETDNDCIKSIDHLTPIVHFLQGFSLDDVTCMDVSHVACYNLALGFLNIPGYVRFVERTVAKSLWSQTQSVEEINNLFCNFPTIQSIVNVVEEIRTPMKFVDRNKMISAVESSPMTWLVYNPSRLSLQNLKAVKDVYRIHIVMNTSLLGRESTERIVSKIMSRGLVDFQYNTINPKNLTLIHCTAWLSPLMSYKPFKNSRELSLEDLLDSTEGWCIGDKETSYPKIDTIECVVVHRGTILSNYNCQNDMIFSKNLWWKTFFN